MSSLPCAHAQISKRLGGPIFLLVAFMTSWSFLTPTYTCLHMSGLYWAMLGWLGLGSIAWYGGMALHGMVWNVVAWCGM